MTRVLVIDEALPHPPDSGKRIRTWELLTRLAKDFDVTLAYHDDGTTPAAAVEATRDARIEPLPVPRKPLKKHGLRFAWDLLRNIPKPVPYMVMAHATKPMQAALREAHERTPFDLVHVEWTPLAANVPPGLHRPVCISAHNVEADIWRRYFENERSFLRRRYIGLQWKKVRRYERAALRVAAAVTAVSEKDAEHIKSWTGNENVITVPNGVNASYFAPDPKAEVDPNELCFVGSLDWRPNLDGATWFLDEVWKPLTALHPEVKLTIVGRNPPAWLTERAAGLERVAVHGDVPDVRPFVRRAAISIVPLRIGGGSRLKIPEALAMERPVVSTTVGAEGLDLGDGLTLADGAEAFAKACADTLANPAAAKARALQGRQRALASHEWGRIAPIQAELWTRLGTAR
ncbi:MAG: glycosyltransferase family 4 protein [Planctomycetota bacterium]|nr:glycosyltransferase family 4 protein [Planctomycetota bacterium]